MASFPLLKVLHGAPLLLVCQILLLSAHLLCMNVASGAPLIGTWFEWRTRQGDSLSVGLARYLAAVAAAALFAGIILGLMLGYLLWTPEYARLWHGPLSYKVKWGLLELVFSLVLLAVIWWWRRQAAGHRGWLVRSLLNLLASTNLLYHFPVLFVVAGQFAEARNYDGPVIHAGAFRELMIGRETPGLAVHFTLASLAVSGMLLLGYSLRMIRHGATKEDADSVATWGGVWALVPSLAQLPVGLWVLLSLPRGMQDRLMGMEANATALFVLSIFAALWLMRELAGVAMGQTERASLVRSMIAMLVVVLLMTAMHQTARRGAATIKAASASEIATASSAAIS